jgi:hypothetical protein
MIKKIFFTLLILLSINSYSQKLFDNDRSYDIFHNYTHWGVQLEPLLFFPADYGGSPANSFQSQVGFGYKAGLIYNLSLSNRIGFRFGAMIGQVPAMNTYFMLSHTETGESTDYFHKKGAVYSPLNYSIPLMLEYRMFMIDRYILNLSAGIQVERTSSALLTENYKTYYRSFLANPGSWDLDMVIKAGWYFQFRKALMLQTNLVYKHRFNSQYEGEYAFENLSSNNSAGTVIQQGDYIGLSFTFHFYRRTRTIEASCRTNQQSQKVRKRQKAAERAKEKAKKRQEKMRKKKAKQMRKRARRS